VRLNPGISGLENFRDPGIRQSRDPGIPRLQSLAEIFGIRKIVSVLLCGVVCGSRIMNFSRYGRGLTCDRQTDGQPDGNMTTAYTALAWRRAVKFVSRMLDNRTNSIHL